MSKSTITISNDNNLCVIAFGSSDDYIISINNMKNCKINKINYTDDMYVLLTDHKFTQNIFIYLLNLNKFTTVEYSSLKYNKKYLLYEIDSQNSKAFLVSKIPVDLN